MVGRNDKAGIYLLEFSDGTATDAALANLKADPDVASVDYNNIFDPPVAAQYRWHQCRQAAAPPSLTLNPNAASDPCNPIIGLIDTGVQSTGSDPLKVMPGTNVTGLPKQT